MEYRANIAISSNIYPRVNRDEKSDPHFVANVRGGTALRAMKTRLYGMGSVQLNEVQRYELSESATCTYTLNYLHEMTHGPVMTDNGVKWLCRCENNNCPRYTSCMPIPLIRESKAVPDIHIPSSAEYEFEWLGEIERIFEQPDIIDEIDAVEDEPIPKEFAEASTILPSDYVQLNSPSVIIEADISSRILVNAGPGTGKTHTVIERLAYIINSGTVDLGQVLVLCYTNAARDVILSRLDEKGLAAESRQLVICTLDSLAWSNLAEKTEADLFALGYNGCIQRFNAEFDPDEWSDFEYVIIDELQDLVNERARMTLKVLKAIKCGYLLLGDKCQAIYDYDCDGVDSIGSVSFYRELENLFPSVVERYELIGNKRQSDDLSRWAEDLRYALLSFSPKDANTYFQDEISILQKSKFLAGSFSTLPNQSTNAILTRNNGEAEWISALLHKENINHSLLRSVSPRPSLNRWIADMFWDYRAPRISYDEFIERYMIRINNNALEAIEAYRALVESALNETDSVLEHIDLAKLNRGLKRAQNISPLLTNVPCSALTVSTIHKAKGREFDHVYLLSGFAPSEDNTEEARIWYVGSTRPKLKLDAISQLKIYVSKPTPMNRRLLTGYKRGRYGGRGTRFCTNVVVGLPQDVNSYSFVGGDLTKALEIQQYIASSVAINDIVELIKIGNAYTIFHEGNVIGELNQEVTSDFWSAIRKISSWSDMPPRLIDVYINNIVTIVPGRYPSGIDAMFKESQFWLGVELTGFAKADWKYGGVSL